MTNSSERNAGEAPKEARTETPSASIAPGHAGQPVPAVDAKAMPDPLYGRRRVLLAATAAVGATGLGAASIPLVESLSPSARARALGSPVIAEISAIEPARQVTFSWRGRPVWVLHRTPEILERLTRARLTSELRDPNSSTTTQQPDYARNATRSIRPQYLVVVGLCTHLGCVPTFSPGNTEGGRDGAGWSGYYCPCHGSRFDFAGRVVKGVPAPTNLMVPPHRYLNPNTVEIGVDPA